MARIRVLLFARAKELAGAGEISVSLPLPATVAACVDEVVARHPRLNTIRAQLLLARNEEYVDARASLSHGDVVALIPPVSGG